MKAACSGPPDLNLGVTERQRRVTDQRMNILTNVFNYFCSPYRLKAVTVKAACSGPPDLNLGVTERRRRVTDQRMKKRKKKNRYMRAYHEKRYFS